VLAQIQQKSWGFEVTKIRGLTQPKRGLVILISCPQMAQMKSESGEPRSPQAPDSTFDGTLICDMRFDASPARELWAIEFAAMSAVNPTLSTT
jgi:hypothetical protein